MSQLVPGFTARRWVDGQWRALYQAPRMLVAAHDIELYEMAGMHVESQTYSHHHRGSWWWVNWSPIVAWVDVAPHILMSLPVS